MYGLYGVCRRALHDSQSDLVLSLESWRVKNSNPCTLYLNELHRWKVLYVHLSCDDPVLWSKSQESRVRTCRSVRTPVPCHHKIRVLTLHPCRPFIPSYSRQLLQSSVLCLSAVCTRITNRRGLCPWPSLLPRVFWNVSCFGTILTTHATRWIMRSSVIGHTIKTDR